MLLYLRTVPDLLVQQVGPLVSLPVAQAVDACMPLTNALQSPLIGNLDNAVNCVLTHSCCTVTDGLSGTLCQQAANVECIHSDTGWIVASKLTRPSRSTCVG